MSAHAPAVQAWAASRAIRAIRFAAAGAWLPLALPLALALALPAEAQTRQPARPAAPAAGQGQALELGTFGDWVAYSTQSGRNKVCYILTKPKERLPKTLNRDPGFLFITSRPAEQVRNEVSFVLGFAARETTPGEASIGATTFALAPKGKNAWIANAAEENSFIEAARRGQSLSVKVTSGRGNLSTDRYSLSGLAQALDRMRRECP
jgi:invasion protein IalB